MFNKTISFCLPATIIFSALMLTSYWVFLVPIFQSPDEDYHADYVFTLYSKKKLIRPSEGPVEACSHPYITYLLEATNGIAMKGFPFVKMPANYGSLSFFQSLDQHAPADYKCAQVIITPYVAAMYPIGYYALTALWLSLLSNFNNHLTFLFFAARFLSVILLGCALIFTYLSLRELRFSFKRSLLILSLVSFFPLTPFVGSYIQPDNLAFALTNICFFLALRWRNTIDSHKQNSINDLICRTKLVWLLGLSLAALLLTKYQFFVCVALAISAMVISRAIHHKATGKNLIVLLSILLTPSIIALIFQAWLSWGSALPPVDSTHLRWSPDDSRIRTILSSDLKALYNYIIISLTATFLCTYTVIGYAFKTFWGEFGWLDTPLIIGSIPLNDVLRNSIEVMNKIIILLTFTSLIKVFLVLYSLIKKQAYSHVLDIAFSNPVINSYFLFTIFINLFYVIYFPSFYSQGRHWFPLILPLFLNATTFAPLILPRNWRQKIFLVIVCALLIYSVLADYFAIGVLRQRYYEPEKQAAINFKNLKAIAISCPYSILDFDFIDKKSTFIRHPTDLKSITVPAGNDLLLYGYAVDALANTPAAAVLIFVDGQKMYQANYGLESTGAVNDLHDSKYRFSCFGTIIPTKGLGVGKHFLSVKVVSANRLFLYNTDKNLDFIIK